AEMMEARDDRICTTDWVIASALRGYLITGTPPIYRASRAIGAHAYVGYDSLTLANALPSTRNKRVLDLGAGCGVQGLLACAGAAEVVLSDIDEFSLRAAALNAVLNETAHPVRFVSGDLFDPVSGEQFDLIVVLPPYLPTVQGSSVADTVGGGPDGLQF